MFDIRTLLFTDVVESTPLSEALGDARMAALWAAHDRVARDLLREHGGREIDKSDGFLLLFDDTTSAVTYVLAYHRALLSLDPPLLARAGLHTGEVILTENAPEDVALGAKRVEVDGLAKPMAARVMALADGGHTLLTRAAAEALGTTALRVVGHGHFRIRGLSEPVEVLEIGEPGAVFSPLRSGRRVTLQDGVWVQVAEAVGAPPLRALIIDDEVRARSRLKRLLAPHTDLAVVGEAGSGHDVLATVLQTRANVVFLDVQMPGASGMEVAAQLGTLLPEAARPWLVFTTAFPDHAVEAFHLGSTDYLLKPIERGRLAEALIRVRRAARAAAVPGIPFDKPTPR